MQLWKCPDARYESRPIREGETPFPDRYRDAVVAASEDQLRLVVGPIENVPKARRFKSVAKVRGSSAKRVAGPKALAVSSATKVLPIGKRTRSQANQASGSEVGGSAAKRVKQVSRKPTGKTSSSRGKSKTVEVISESDAATESDAMGSDDEGDNLSGQEFAAESPNADEPLDSGAREPRFEVDPEQATQVFIPPWSVKNGDTFDNHDVCRDMVDHLIPPSEVVSLECKSDVNVGDEMNWLSLMVPKIVGEGRRRWEGCYRQLIAEREKVKKLKSEMVDRDERIEELNRDLTDLTTDEVILLKDELKSAKADRDNAIAKLKDVATSHGSDLELLRTAHADALESEVQKTVNATRRVQELEVRLSEQEKQQQELERKWEMEKQSLTTVAAASVNELGEASNRSSAAEESFNWLMDRGLKEAFVKLVESPEYVAYNGAVQAAHCGVGKKCEAISILTKFKFQSVLFCDCMFQV